MSIEIDKAFILPDFPGAFRMPQCDKLWMCLYAKLGKLVNYVTNFVILM